MAASNIDITANTILSSKVLDSCWRQWIKTQAPEINCYFNSYKHVSRRNKLAVDFENWLFIEGKGAVVRQHYSNRYLEFTNETAASMFILKWAT